MASQWPPTDRPIQRDLTLGDHDDRTAWVRVPARRTGRRRFGGGSERVQNDDHIGSPLEGERPVRLVRSASEREAHAVDGGCGPSGKDREGDDPESERKVRSASPTPRLKGGAIQVPFREDRPAQHGLRDETKLLLGVTPCGPPSGFRR